VIDVNRSKMSRIPSTDCATSSNGFGLEAHGRLPRSYDGWLKEAAPSAELRKWFSHDRAK
jgi:hypothetical protein